MRSGSKRDKRGVSNEGGLNGRGGSVDTAGDKGRHEGACGARVTHARVCLYVWVHVYALTLGRWWPRVDGR